MNELIEEHLKQFDYSAKVRKLSDVIKVDDMVDGCPMDTNAFQTVLTKYLKLFGVTEDA